MDGSHQASHVFCGHCTHCGEPSHSQMPTTLFQQYTPLIFITRKHQTKPLLMLAVNFSMAQVPPLLVRLQLLTASYK